MFFGKKSGKSYDRIYFSLDKQYYDSGFLLHQMSYWCVEKIQSQDLVVYFLVYSFYVDGKFEFNLDESGLKNLKILTLKWQENRWYTL